MSHPYFRDPKKDEVINITIKWWPYPSKAAPSYAELQPIRVRCMGWSYTRANVPTFRVESTQTMDPLPPQLNSQERTSIRNAIAQELQERLGKKIVLVRVAQQEVGL